jgi:CRISPR-associated protein Cst2
MKVAQISIIGKISGNVNADEVIGTRVTLKKMYSSNGDVLPFVSSRALKFSIRQALKEKGEDALDIDSFVEDPNAEEALRLCDSGNPIKYADNDLFGYMVTRGRGQNARRRQGPIAFSYFKALKDTPIRAEFAARFPRAWGNRTEENPVPFEIEVAEFMGKVNCIMYENIGKFEENELENAQREGLIREEKDGKNWYTFNDKGARRKKRIETFLQILLGPSYVLPRRTNSLNMPEYVAALVTLSSNGPLPVFQYLNYDFEKNQISQENLKALLERTDIKISGSTFLLIDYLGGVNQVPEGLSKKSVTDAVSEITDHLCGKQ